jgi:hypothetical protein
MRTQGCRWLVVVLLVVPALFLLQACGGGSGSGQTPVRTVPSIGSISPASVAAGANSLTLTVTGLNFLSGATVCWNGASLPTTVVSATELTATVAGSQLATGATVTITAVNPGSGGGTSNGVTFAVSNPAPVVARMAPSWAQAGSSAALIRIDGSGFTSGSQIRWNGTAVITTYVDANRLTASVPALNLASAGTASVTVFNPSPGGGTSTTLVFTTFASGPNYVTSLSMDVTAMAWDASRGRIYAALSGTAANGNGLVAIDPLTGATTTPVFVGSDPKLLALSSDASHLWVSLDGASAIQRVTLPSMTPDLRINIPSYWYGPQVALAMQAAPVSPNALAVVIGDHRVSPPDTGGVAIYDGTVQRPGTIPGQYPADMTWLVWGSDDSKLYGFNGGDSGADFCVMNADASGVRVGTKYGRIFPGQSIQIHYDRSTGRVYADDGHVFDPSTGVLVGAFNLRDFSVSACLPDPVLPTVFFLGRDAERNNVYTLRAFDKNTYRQIGTLEFPQATGDAHNLIRWGSAGIAFDTTPTGSGGAGVVYIVDGAFVNASADSGFTGSQEATLLPVLTAMAPESAAVGSQDLALTVSGSAFKPTTVVYWNSQALGTTYHSPTELRAIVTASTLAQEGCATISVGNDLTANAVNSLAFTVLPASSRVIVRNLSSPDIAWDPHSSRLYAPVSSDDPLSPNSIVAIDPADGSISSITGVGPDPSLLSARRNARLRRVPDRQPRHAISRAGARLADELDSRHGLHLWTVRGDGHPASARCGADDGDCPR